MNKNNPKFFLSLFIVFLINAYSGSANSNVTDSIREIPLLRGECPEFAPTDFPGRKVFCRKLIITCESSSPATVILRVVMPLGAPKGAIMFGSGGNGKGMFASDRGRSNRGVAVKFLRELSDYGYVILTRSWLHGWFGEGENNSDKGKGILKLSCRYNNLMKWVKNTSGLIDAKIPLCAHGNSGGATEIAMSLSRYNLDDYINAAVLSGGPPMANLGTLCKGEFYDSKWLYLEEGVFKGNCIDLRKKSGQNFCFRPDGKPICSQQDRMAGTGGLMDSSIGPVGSCTDRNNHDYDLKLKENSILFPQARLHYKSAVHFISGDRDCSESPLHGRLFYEQITSKKSYEVSPDTGHAIEASIDGMNALKKFMINNCK
jgi:hypothetical protein